MQVKTSQNDHHKFNKDSMNFVPMIELTRNGISECLHLGALAVTDTHGKLIASAGNPHWLCFTRSTLKALQALPLMQSDGAKHFGFSSQELALMCASHNGEDMHVACPKKYRNRIVFI